MYGVGPIPALGLFGIGQPPTGSKDPYALRRATVGLLRIIIEQGLELDLGSLVIKAYHLHGNLSVPVDKVQPQLLDFIFDRLRAYYEDQKIAIDLNLAKHYNDCMAHMPAWFKSTSPQFLKQAIIDGSEGLTDKVDDLHQFENLYHKYLEIFSEPY